MGNLEIKYTGNKGYIAKLNNGYLGNGTEVICPGKFPQLIHALVKIPIEVYAKGINITFNFEGFKRSKALKGEESVVRDLVKRLEEDSQKSRKLELITKIVTDEITPADVDRLKEPELPRYTPAFY